MDRGIIINAGGAGGASLNYKVVGGLTAPENPANNTIWVATDTEITSHVFSTSEPTSPAEGLVWFNVGLSCSAPINLLKKDNTIMVYPTAVQQYVGGAWVGKEAKTYQGSKWVDWLTYLIRNGIDNEELTGGWVCEAKAFQGGDRTKAPTITLSDGLFTIELANGDANYGYGGIAHTANKINCTDLASIEVQCDNSGIKRVSEEMYAWTEIGNRVDLNVAAKTALFNVESPIVLDVSALNGEYYIGFGMYSMAKATNTLAISDMILHKK